MRILIIEDNEKLAKTLKESLEKKGYTVDYVLDGEKGQRRLELYHKDYDLAIIDWMLPLKTGIDICKDMRARDITTPILILTAKLMTEEKVEGLNSGADDYLTKPFELEELVARIKALTRRPVENLFMELKIKDIKLNTVNGKVFRSGREIPLTLKEFRLLEYLMKNAGRVLNREEIFDNIWDFTSNSFSNVIDVHINNLRKKIESKNPGNILETVRGIGYRIRTD